MNALLLLLLSGCTVDPTKPRDVAYDHVSCAHCGMMVGDARFAAQLYTPEGRWEPFDDPACAFRYVREHAVPHASVWFRDGSADHEAWLSWGEAGFVAATGAPMDGGVMAVPRSSPGAASADETSVRLGGGGSR